jgi:hypothetical protein
MINQYNHYKSRSSILVLLYKKGNVNTHMPHFLSPSSHFYIVIKLKIKTKVLINYILDIYSLQEKTKVTMKLNVDG